VGASIAIGREEEEGWCSSKKGRQEGFGEEGWGLLGGLGLWVAAINRE